jgi:hypothetical protein
MHRVHRPLSGAYAVYNPILGLTPDKLIHAVCRATCSRGGALELLLALLWRRQLAKVEKGPGGIMRRELVRGVGGGGGLVDARVRVSD